MKLRLGGHLNWYEPQKRAVLEISLEGPTSLVKILLKLNLPAGEVVLVVVNGELAELLTCVVVDDDVVALYPPIGGGAE